VDWVALLQEGEAVLPRLGSESDLSDWSEEEGDKSEEGDIKVLMTGPCFEYLLLSSFPNPYVFGPPGSVGQRYGTGSFHHQAEIVRKNLLFCDLLVTFYL
jgi:hypothetical protein